jgi:hypothetical protein
MSETGVIHTPDQRLRQRFRTVLAVADRTRSFAPGDRSALIRNEVSRVFTTVLVQPGGLP